jgi:hypothetical protein
LLGGDPQLADRVGDAPGTARGEHVARSRPAQRHARAFADGHVPRAGGDHELIALAQQDEHVVSLDECPATLTTSSRVFSIAVSPPIARAIAAVASSPCTARSSSSRRAATSRYGVELQHQPAPGVDEPRELVLVLSLAGRHRRASLPPGRASDASAPAPG